MAARGGGARARCTGDARRSGSGSGAARARGAWGGRGRGRTGRPRRRAAASGGAAAGPQQQGQGEGEGEGARACLRYTVELTKPLGVVLEESNGGGAGIFVAEVAEGGAAERDGQIKVGDELIACSGVVKTTTQTYNDVSVGGGEEVVRMSVRGQRFEVVTAAIGSHPGNFKVKLELERCDENR